MTYIFAFTGGGGGGGGTSTTGQAVPHAAIYFVVGIGDIGGVGGIAFASVLEVFLIGTAVTAMTPATSAGRLCAYMMPHGKNKKPETIPKYRVLNRIKL